MILDHVYWNFGKKFDTYETFIKEVKDYNDNISDDHKWNPDQVVVNKEKARVFFEALWKDEDDLLEIEIEAGNGQEIKMGEMLFKINNESADFFAEADATFFEGLHEMESEDGIPEFDMWTGS